MSAPGKNNLKVCKLCTKAIGRDDVAHELRQADATKGPQATDKVIGWAHEKCGMLAEIQRLNAICQQLEASWRNALNMAASVVEAMGGSVRIPAEVPDRVAADGNQLNPVKQDDGSWKIERPSLIVNPTGAVLPPPPGAMSTVHAKRIIK